MTIQEKLSPTPERERQAHAGSVEKVELLSEKGERVEVEAAKKYLSPVEALKRKDALTDGEVLAAETYHRDWYIGCNPSRTIPRYDEYIGCTHEGDTSLDAHERQVFHHNRWAKADEFLGPHDRLYASILVLERELDGGIAPLSLEQCGRMIAPHYKRKDVAVAAAVGVLKVILAKLQKFYGIR